MDLGVAEVIIYAVNDGAVLSAWEQDQGTEGTLLNIMGDPLSELTKALGLVLDHPGPMDVLGNPRCQRFSMLIEDGVIKTINVAAADDDPAGDARPEISMVEKMLEDCTASSYRGIPAGPVKAALPKKPPITDPAKFVADAIKSKGISVFSKTYCPASKRTLSILKGAKAKMSVYQLDLYQEPANGPVQQELNKMTGVLSVPQVFVDGKFIGSGEKMEELAAAGTLKETLQIA
jgi:glutaredoxin